MEIVEEINKPCIVGFIGDTNTGKTNTLYYLIESYAKNYKFNLYYFGLREDIKEGHRIYSLEELETIENSLVIIDEFFTLFDLNNSKSKGIIETTLRLIHHNNNILILAGLPENFKKFISAKLDLIIYKQCKLSDFINQSQAKTKLTSYRGYELGNTLLKLPKNKALFFNGTSYKVLDIPYLKHRDTKQHNESIFKKKSSKGAKK